MHTASHPPQVQSVTSGPQQRRYTRFGIFLLLSGCCAAGIFAISVLLQSRSQAQAVKVQEAQARAAEFQVRRGALKAPDQNTWAAGGPVPSGAAQTALPSSPVYLSTGLQAEAPPTTRMVPQQHYEPVVDPITGGTIFKRVTRMVPFTAYQDSNPSQLDESPLDNEIQQLAAQYRSAKPGLKESISQSLNQKVTELFEARHKAQASRVAALRKEVEQTQELLEKRLQLKSKIVERRVKELTGQQDELSWNAAVANVSPTIPVPSQSDAPIYSPSGGFQPGPTTNLGEPRSYGVGEYSSPSSYQPTPGYQPTLAPKYGTPIQESTRSFDNDEALSVVPRQSVQYDSLPTPVTNEQSSSVPPNTQILGLPQNIQGPSLQTPIPSNESLPVLGSVPFISDPSIGNPSITVPVSGGSAGGSPANVTPLESQRSFMSIGFKLKNLYRELEEEKKKSSDATLSKDAKTLQYIIEENKSLWEFEKSALESALETANSECEIVEKQLEHATKLVKVGRARFEAAQGQADEYLRAEVSFSETERQLTQLRSRVATLKKSIAWMEDFFKEQSPMVFS